MVRRFRCIFSSTKVRSGEKRGLPLCLFGAHPVPGGVPGGSSHGGHGLVQGALLFDLFSLASASSASLLTLTFGSLRSGVRSATTSWDPLLASP